jgi:hypothetical protein
MSSDENNSQGLAAPSLASQISSLRKAVRQIYPEIDELYSDAYLEAVLSVPERAYEYARDEKISKALQWRREYGVDQLTDAFCCDDGEELGCGIFRTKQINNAEDVNGNQHQQVFLPSQYLVDACLSGAFCFAGFDNQGRGILNARTSLFDWWQTGVEDGIRYHVLVIEYALQMIAERNKRKKYEGGDNNVRNKEASLTPESMVLYVDVSNMSKIPPPMGALTGMARLLQRAYPDRIHIIYIGPVNPVLRTVYGLIAPYLRPRSRDKIVLLDDVPQKDVVEVIEAKLL